MPTTSENYGLAAIARQLRKHIDQRTHPSCRTLILTFSLQHPIEFRSLYLYFPCMSRAFVREPDGDSAAEDFPERIVSEHPNFVTARGLQLIEHAIHQLERDRELAKTVNDAAARARTNRDLRYWQQRKASAKLVAPEPLPTKVRFGVTVALAYEAGVERKFTLVGEDEADPANNLISWASPVAQALLGHEAGDEVALPGNRVEIMRISAAE